MKIRNRVPRERKPATARGIFFAHIVGLTAGGVLNTVAIALTRHYVVPRIDPASALAQRLSNLVNSLPDPAGVSIEDDRD
jgi:hypothetical protein